MLTHMGGWWSEYGGDNGIMQRRLLVPDRVHTDTVRSALRRRDIVSLQRGIYVPGDRSRNPIEAACAAVHAVDEPGSAASHHTAARVHGLVVPDGGPDHLTIPRAQRRPHRDRLRIYTARLPAEDVVDVDGVPLTSVARTTVDLSRVLPRVPAVWAVEGALRSRTVTRAELEEVAVRLARSPGIVRARERFRSAEPLSQSPLETMARLFLLDAGLPAPELQMELELADGRSVFVDLGYREQRVGIELDGRSPHELPEAVFRDRRRQNKVAFTSVLLLRYTWWDVKRDTRRFVDEVDAALARHR